MELLNPAEVFHGIMVDYPYVECTSACMQALSLFRAHFPAHATLKPRVDAALSEGLRFILGQQRADGSWRGSWAVCFAYATWFGVEAIVASGEKPTQSEAVRKACAFLLTKQKPDGKMIRCFLLARCLWVTFFFPWFIVVLFAYRYSHHVSITLYDQMVCCLCV